MALGRRKREQQAAWVATTDLPRSPGHPFYKKLNQLLAVVNEAFGIRTYIPEPRRRSRWKWSERPAAERRAVTANHRRVAAARSQKLQRLRSEFTERTFAHVCETGGARRCWLHGRLKVAKRYLLQVAARNLGRIMRHLFGIGTPKGLQKNGDAVSSLYLLAFALSRLLKIDLSLPPVPLAIETPTGPDWKPSNQTAKHDNFNGLLGQLPTRRHRLWRAKMKATL